MADLTQIDLLPVVDRLLLDHKLFHSEFQIDCFITARAGDHHPWGMFVQALRELHSRRSSLLECEQAVEKNKINIEESRWKLSKRAWTRKAKFEKRREALHLQALIASEKSLQAKLSEIYRETARFVDQALALKKLVGDDLSLERRLVLDREYWLHKLKLRVCTHLLSHNTTPVDIYHMLPGLHVDVRAPLLAFLQTVQSRSAALSHLASLSPSSPSRLKLA